MRRPAAIGVPPPARPPRRPFPRSPGRRSRRNAPARFRRWRGTPPATCDGTPAPRPRNDPPPRRRRAAPPPAQVPCSGGRSSTRVRSGRQSPTATCSSRSISEGASRPARALVGARRIGETVAHDPGAARERRRDQRVDMVDARRRESDRLGRRTEPAQRARQDQLAQFLCVRRAAGLAGGDDFQPKIAEPARKPARLRGLACALAAFKSDETAVPQRLNALRSHSSPSRQAASLARCVSVPIGTADLVFSAARSISVSPWKICNSPSGASAGKGAGAGPE